MASIIESAELTGGAGDVPRSIRGAAQSLASSGGGGTIWLLTDLQAAGWRTADTGAWQETRASLEDAGRPRLVITDLAPRIDRNFSIAGLHTTPPILTEGQPARLAATVRLRGEAGGVTTVVLVLKGRSIDKRALEFKGPGTKEIVFNLPPLDAGAHAGHLELEPDAMPADDRCYFVLRVGDQIPVLIADGARPSDGFDGSAGFLMMAVEPPAPIASKRSPFSARRIPIDGLADTNLKSYAAIFLADVVRLAPRTIDRLRAYVSDGGLLILFPGPNTDVAAWNESGFPGLPMRPLIEAETDKPIRVNWASPTSPVTMTLPAEGLDQLMIKRLYPLDAGDRGQVLLTTDTQHPLLVRVQMGEGKIYVFSVPCHDDFSNLPLTPIFLLTIHRAIRSHLIQLAQPPAHAAFAELSLSLPPGPCSILLPGGRIVPVPPAAGPSGAATFSNTEQIGIYRLIEGDTAPESAPAVAAINVPAEESTLDRLDADAIRRLLPDYPVSIMRVDGGAEALRSRDGDKMAATSFPLAALATMLWLGALLLAWRIGPASASRNGGAGTEAMAREQ